MSDTLVAPGELPTLDISGTTKPPFFRLVGVELRKLVDTRAGKWLLITMGLLTMLVMIIQLWIGLATDISLRYGDFIAGTTYSIGFLLPILAIISLTSEWGQRTAMVTFALEPNRVKVAGAKLVAALAVAVVSVIFAILFGALANVLYGALGDASASWDTSGKELTGFLLGQLLVILTGFALGALLLSTAGAIVAYFVYSFILPGLFMAGAALLDWFEPIQKWLDFGTAQIVLVGNPETGAAPMEGSGEDWARLLVSMTVWVLVPLGVGIWRIIRSEAK